MSKVLLLIISIFVLSQLSLSAAAYKGQREFLKKCVSCHSKKQAFISTKYSDEWEDFMDNNGKELADLHLRSEDAKKSWKYFKSKKYTKKVKHLEDFLLEYAKDSGNVPACN